MGERVVVLGAGYAGVTAIQHLQRKVNGRDVVWISDCDRHLMLHEVHRVIRSPAAADHLTIQLESIASASTTIKQGSVVGVDVKGQQVVLADGTTVAYDYLLVALGSRTAFYGIPGLRDAALTVKGLDDALEIHDAIREAAGSPSSTASPRVIIGGAGLSGVQVAGEVSQLRDESDLSLTVTLLEAYDSILPGSAPSLQSAIRRRLNDRAVAIQTATPIVGVNSESVAVETGDPLPYDVLIWTGGIAGRDAIAGAALETEHDRLLVDATFSTSDPRVFAVGDTAIIDQDETDPAPPTAQAAWQAGAVAAENLIRRMTGTALQEWTFVDKGTVVSIGESAVAHDVRYVPVETFGGVPARLLKKGIAARWLANTGSVGQAVRAWRSL